MAENGNTCAASIGYVVNRTAANYVVVSFDSYGQKCAFGARFGCLLCRCYAVIVSESCVCAQLSASQSIIYVNHAVSSADTSSLRTYSVNNICTHNCFAYLS